MGLAALAMTAMAPAPPGRTLDKDGQMAVARRLRRLRFAFDLPTAEALADKLRLPRSTVANWESGAKMLPVPAAIQLCVLFGVTTDWLYRGLEHTLPASVQLKLQRSPEHLFKPKPRRQRSTSRTTLSEVDASDSN